MSEPTGADWRNLIWQAHDGHRRGWWNMTCWNGLNTEQQTRLITVGNLPMGYIPEGECSNGAEVEITTMWDEAPGPRFYCSECAIQFLTDLQRLRERHS